MTENMKLWDAICKTDATMTKGFKRAGGFSGTAIKPIYSIKRMTETFGPVGFGWGYSKPEFVTHQHDKEILVYCIVGVWFKVGAEKSDLFYGVGGDFVVVGQKSGLRADDEAYKKAFTDAMANAFKHMGMSADIHMGMFDGSKYAADDHAPAPVARSAAPKSAFSASPIPVGVTEEGKADWQTWAKALNAQIKLAPTPDDLHKLMKAHEAPLATLKSVSTTAHDALFKSAATRFATKE